MRKFLECVVGSQIGAAWIILASGVNWATPDCGTIIGISLAAGCLTGILRAM